MNRRSEIPWLTSSSSDLRRPLGTPLLPACSIDGAKTPENQREGDENPVPMNMPDHTQTKLGIRFMSCRASWPRLGSNQDSPDPESVRRGSGSGQVARKRSLTEHRCSLPCPKIPGSARRNCSRPSGR
jgi:hypothetical protein